MKSEVSIISIFPHDVDQPHVGSVNLGMSCQTCECDYLASCDVTEADVTTKLAIASHNFHVTLSLSL